MKKNSAWRLLCAFLLLKTFSGHAQDSLQRSRMAALWMMAGAWNVEVEARLSLNGPWENSNGEAAIVLALDSTLLEEHFIGARRGARFESKTFTAVNNSNYRYDRVFIDAPHGVMLSYEGELGQDSLVFNRTHYYSNGNSVLLRTVYILNGSDAFDVHTMRLPTGSGQWDTTSRMRYRRKK